MNIVFAYHEGDADLALLSAQAIVAMGPNFRHNATICCAYNTKNFNEIEAELKKVFVNVEHIVSQDGFDGWPLGPNQMFDDCAAKSYTKDEAWYFWEPDCVPIKSGWADALYDEYKQKPCILGTKFSNNITSDGQEMKEMIVGSAIYPPNLLDLCPLVRSLNDYNMAYRSSQTVPEPWDIRSRHEFLKIGRNTDLIKTYWKSVNYIQSQDKIVFFAQDPESQAIQNIVCPDRVVDMNAVVIHGCKDGSLHRMAINRFVMTQPILKEKDTTISVKTPVKQASTKKK
jgi:hypothetical protein